MMPEYSPALCVGWSVYTMGVGWCVYTMGVGWCVYTMGVGWCVYTIILTNHLGFDSMLSYR